MNCRPPPIQPHNRVWWGVTAQTMARMSNLTDVVTGQKTVTTSGTPEAMSSATNIAQGVVTVIKSKPTNTGRITVGNSSANALNSGTGFFSLSPGESMEVQISDLSRIFIDATVSGEGVEYLYER